MPLYVPPSSSSSHLHQQHKDCGYCRTQHVTRCFLILLILWIIFMIVLAGTAHQWRPDHRPHHLLNPKNNNNKIGLTTTTRKLHHHQTVISENGGDDDANSKPAKSSPHDREDDEGDDDSNRHNIENDDDDTDEKDDEQHHFKIERLDDAIRAKSTSTINNAEKLNCFAVVVSNEEYIDGTLVLGYSLRKYSKLAQTGKAELVVLVPENSVSRDSIDRLHLAGWNHVLQVDDLAKKAPKAHWAGTFNKLYLFHLVQYSLVAFFDADMVIQHNPDYIFRTHLKDDEHIGALGNSLFDHTGKPRPAYFQTGMMLLIPSEKAFRSMMDDFYHGKDSRGLNGRDGLIIRRFFGKNYKNLDDALSAHVGTSLDYDWVTGLHYRGGFKPWFNRLNVPPYDEQEVRRIRKKKGAGADIGPPGKWLEIGPAYSVWWQTYEEFHRTIMMPRDLKLMMTMNKKKKHSKQNKDDNHDVDIPEGYDPRTRVWMNRHSKKKSYVQYLQRAAAEERQRVLDEEKFPPSVFEIMTVLGDKGQNCDHVCGSLALSKNKNDDVHVDDNDNDKDVAATKNSKCYDELLTSPRYAQSCAIINEFMKDDCVKRRKKNSCDQLKGRVVPTVIQPDSSSCAFNTMLNPFVKPLCNATPARSDTRRICVCARRKNKNDDTGNGNKRKKMLNNNNRHAEQQDTDDDGKQSHHHQHNDEKEQQQEKEKEKEEENKSSNRGKDSGESNHHESDKDKHDDNEERNNNNNNKESDTTRSLCHVGDQHSNDIHPGCILRLRDSKHLGSWSLLSSSPSSSSSSSGFGRKEQKQKHEEEEEEEEEVMNNKNNKNENNVMLLPILSRHHDGFAETFWFPQQSAPFSLEKILFSHLLGRVLHFDWVPPTTILQLPLKKAPKLLNQKLHLHSSSDKKHDHDHHNNHKTSSDTINQRVSDEIVDYLVPDGTCPEVFVAKRKHRKRNNKQHDNNDDDNDIMQGETGNAGDWSVRVVVSARTSHEIANHDDDAGTSNSASHYAERQLFEFLLGVKNDGVVDNNNHNTNYNEWENIIENMDSHEMRQNHVLIQRVPRCLLLSKISQDRRRELFGKRVVNSTAIVAQIEQDEPPMIHRKMNADEKDHHHNNSNNNNSNNKSEQNNDNKRKHAAVNTMKTSLEILSTFLNMLRDGLSTDEDLVEVLSNDFGLDVDKWKFQDENDKDSDLMRLFRKMLLLPSSSSRRRNNRMMNNDENSNNGNININTSDNNEFYFFLLHVSRRLEMVQSLISRCQLL